MRRILTVSVLAVFLTLGWDTLAFPQAHFQGCHIAVNPAMVPVACRVGPGTLYALTINTKGGSGNYTYLFDAASYSVASVAGVPIMVVDTTAGPLTLVYNILVTKGVVVWNTSGTTADLTIATE